MTNDSNAGSSLPGPLAGWPSLSFRALVCDLFGEVVLIPCLCVAGLLKDGTFGDSSHNDSCWTLLSS